MTIPAQDPQGFQDMKEFVDWVTGGEDVAAGAYRSGIGGRAITRVRTGSPVSLLGDTSAQSYLPAAGNAFSVRSGIAYRFMTHVFLKTGTTTHTTAWGLTLATATLHDIRGIAEYSAAADDTLAAWQAKEIDQATATIINATNTVAEGILRVSGLLEVNAAGTISPFVQFSADPVGGVHTAEPGTFFEIWPIGAYNVAAQGNFA